MDIDVSKEVQRLKDIIKELSDELQNVLLKKSHLVKAGIGLKTEYIMKIGKYELGRYRLYYEFQKLKRMIAVYQAAINIQKTITEKEVEKIIKKDIEEYEKKLKILVDDYNTALWIENSEQVNDEVLREIKKIYRVIVKRIHPDLNPNLSDEFKALWHMTQNAYTFNDLNKLKTLLTLIESKEIIIEQHSNEIDRLEDMKKQLEEKILIVNRKIREIETEFPFNKSSILQDKEMVSQIVMDIKMDIDKYQEINEELVHRLDFLKNPVHGVS